MGLPDNQTQSGILSRSTKGGTPENANELRFEDKKGEEKVTFHAEKDFDRVVENNDSLKVGFEKKDEGSQTIEIWKNRSAEIKTGDDSTKVSAGNHTIKGICRHQHDRGGTENHAEGGGQHDCDRAGEDFVDVAGNCGRGQCEDRRFGADDRSERRRHADRLAGAWSKLTDGPICFGTPFASFRPMLVVLQATSSYARPQRFQLRANQVAKVGRSRMG